MRIGFIGLGNMGLPMAGHLVAAGHAVRGFDLRAEAVAAFVAAGGTAARGVAEATEDAELTITILPASADVRAALLAPGLPWRRGTVAIDMTSGEPAATIEIGRALARHGVAMIDAPVSGGVKGARAKSLTIMVGGDDEIVARCEPVLAAMGARIFRCGGLGAGQAVKALNNFVSAAGLLAAGEALTIAQRFGIEPERLVDILNASTGRNNTTENKLKPFVLSGTHDDGFALRLMAKDVAIAAGLADRTATRGGLAAETARRWAEAAGALGAGANHTEIIRLLGFKATART
ncbi:MAG: NAD(P)-dependent oxidoreductase [Phreatobacter sp.]|uniref:NAD(P)-dependent oxidoreductase n=1 Tax=Phreatobacter sp. TaxID=1966341 RepID=UPI001A4122CE|nr:NAD(P)-dependent oxidoreductase [Phreatobacter sp.]MBL8571857.1 NAD(P)-dependent oxidoreductase [Phreatobacter sp.]